MANTKRKDLIRKVRGSLLVRSKGLAYIHTYILKKLKQKKIDGTLRPQIQQDSKKANLQIKDLD